LVEEIENLKTRFLDEKIKRNHAHAIKIARNDLNGLEK
jgi:hypothetical protein